MCGRFTLSYKANELQLSLGITDIPEDWEPRYNIAPTQAIPAVINPVTKKMEFLYWGLVPSWAKDVSIGSKMINARSETVLEKPSFKNAFLRRRCLILADGFYEWKRSAKSKISTPYYFQLEDREIFALAGIYEIWHSPEGSELWSGSIITCPANELVAPIHDRMPIMLDKENMWAYLDNKPITEIKAMLAPFDATQMIAHEVSPKVNSGRVDSPDLVEAV
ncbi:MAG: hypothetical protein BGO78_17755 [Chloroflexi bacterium 44-23]|nr:MAG: hypothetical protein BGO78_17755 [Chloroflexi bacterium 44-23]